MRKKIALVLIASLLGVATIGCTSKEKVENTTVEKEAVVTEDVAATPEAEEAVDSNELPAGAVRIPIPGLEDEGMNYVALGYHGNSDPSLTELSIGELEGFEGNAIKTRVKQLVDEPFWIFGIDLSEAEDSPCMDLATFTNLKKITFDYTSTEDYSSEVFNQDLMVQLVWKYYEEVKGTKMENIALTAEMNINFTKTDDIVTYEIDFANDYPEFAQTLAQAVADYDTLHLDFLQFGFHNGLSFDDEYPFTPFNLQFGNVTFYCE